MIRSDVAVLSSLAGLSTWIYLHCCPCRGDTFVTVLLFLTVLSYGALVFVGHNITDAAVAAHLYLDIFCVSCLSSVVVYRFSPWHPLAVYPGPVLSRITSLRAAWIVWQGRQFLDIAALHRKYGAIVRTGPNTLSFHSRAASMQIYQSGNLAKSESYLLHVPGKSLFFTTSTSLHRARRKLWAKAFTQEALQGYFPRLEESVSELLDWLVKHSAGRPIDIGECLSRWSYDFMTKLVFGSAGDLHLLQTGDPLKLVQGGVTATRLWQTLGQIPWLFDIVEHLPVTGAIRAIRNVAAEHIARKRVSKREVDIASYLLDEEGTSLATEDVHIDALFAIQAGSDTTPGMIIPSLYFILSNSTVYARVRTELLEAFPVQDSPLDSTTLSELPYFNAVINEAMRLSTPIAGFPRVVQQDGMTIDGTFVPGGTVVSVAPYMQAISEENVWPEPLEFKPERWLPGGLGPESRLEKAYVGPFSMGTYSCLGKQVALEDIRYVIARLLLSTNITLAPGYDVEKFLKGMRNYVSTFFTHPLLVEIRGLA